MPSSRAFPVFVAVSCILIGAVSAQNKLSLQFIAFPKERMPEPVELVVGDNKTIEVQTPGHELSPVYQVSPLETIVVGKTIQNEEGETTFEVYGQAKALGTSNQIILLIRNGQENSDGFAVLPLNGELGDFGGGSYLFINASKKNVGGVIGDSKFALKPGQRRLLKPEPDHENDICQVTLSYQRDDEWKVFKDTRWPANERYRSLIFFHQDPKSGRLAVAPVIDMLPYQSSSTN